ncbi:magnesium-dependent phosphatase-1 [Gymnopilus junonius]|uniref:Magnesium-dependent phosphatase-1 n=1 Tax=Gymnopilus junonius TaxID=109634 RepID=A0A9P5TFG1_GYMJU|nr:magnesium-dependent phosphatase-1 [Gymnopilus junonius]
MTRSNSSDELHPQLVAFDLDYTLWDLWIDTHVTGPLKRNGNTINEVLDKFDEPISFYKDVPEILHGLRSRSLPVKGDEVQEDRQVVIAACSRTHAPDLAQQCLRLLLIPPSSGSQSPRHTPAIEFFDELEIYPGSKIKHFREIHKRTGVPFSEMLFFDDESRNAEVEKLGVTFCHVPRGLNSQIFEKGLKEWRRRQANE